MRTQHLGAAAILIAAACFPTLTVAQQQCDANSLDVQCIRQQNNLKIDKDRVSVSGISSGAFMAHQFHVAHSAHVMGVGIVAGGPYYCAEANILNAIAKCSGFAVLACEEQMRLSPFGAGICVSNYTGPKNEQEAIAVAGRSFAEANKLSGNQIDDVANISKAKVYLFRGESDRIVPSGIMQAVQHFYTDQDKGNVNANNVAFNDTFNVRHSMVTDNFYRKGKNIVGACNPKARIDGDTYITDCGQDALSVEAKNACTCSAEGCYGNTPASDKICRDASDVDLAGAILAQLYGTVGADGPPHLKGARERLVPQGVSGAELDQQLNQYVQPFDQKAIFAYFDSWPANALIASSMAEKGYIYIPEACKNGNASCGLHVAFHGCLQGDNTGGKAGGGYSGNLYSKYAGYNEWAKNNNIVVVYPQVQAWNSGPMNPQGCWDWWGQYYTHDGYHTKAGTQIKAVAQMIDVLVDDNDFLEVPKSGS